MFGCLPQKAGEEVRPKSDNHISTGLQAEDHAKECKNGFKYELFAIFWTRHDLQETAT